MYSKDTSAQANYAGQIQSLDSWNKFIKGGRAKTSRPVANNTVARFENGGVAIKLHNTDIVTILSNGNIALNSGGWLTVTTKERINRYTNAGISQKGGIWYMTDGSLFYDGITIRPDGTPVKPKQPAAYEKKLKAIKKEAREYARGFVKALEAGTVDAPSGGDCWYCLFIDKGNTTSTDHIKQHIKDKYYVPSLLVNAGRAAGYRDEQIGLMGIGGHRLFIDPENNIYKYIVKTLQRGL